MVHRVRQLHVIASTDLLYAGLAIEAHADGLVGLHELVELSRQLLILHGDDTDVVVERINLDLQVRIIIEKGRVRVASTLKLLSHVHDLVLLAADLGLEVLDAGSELNVAGALGVNALLEVDVLVAVLLLESLQVVQLILETDDLVLELDDLTLALDELSFLTLEVESLRVNELVEVIDTGELLGDVILEGTRLSSKLGGLAALHLVGTVKLIDLLGVLSVTLSKVVQLLLEVLLLRVQLGVEVLMLSKVGLELGNLGVATVENVLLAIELGIEVSILLLAVDEEMLLVIDLLTEGRDHVDVDLDTALVVILHASLLVGDAVEVLLKGKQLILQHLVLALLGSEVHGLSAQLSDKSVLVVLLEGSVRKISLGAS